MLAAIGTVLFRFRYYRIIGRFHRLRRLIADVQARRQGGAIPPAGAGFRNETLRWVEEVRSRGFCPGPSLEGATVAAIRRFAEEQPCRRPAGAEGFRICDVRDGRTPQGDAVAVANVVEPTDCPEVARIAQDPLLLETATRYLGYRPRRTETRLYWSPISALPEAVRHSDGQAVGFHYDIDACNSFYLYFYLAGGSSSSGAHVVVEGSHGPKPLRMIFGSAFQPEKAVLDRYGAGSVKVVAGDPGFGFFEDPACFHKALVPTTEPRLCLQLRYS